jgi:TRAP-type C4-dicarboxylate transport system substrate-binding protein
MARAGVAAVAAAGLLAMVVATAEAETTLKFGHYNAESHPMHKAAVQFKENVERRTGGEVLVEIYPNNTLGSPPEILEQTRNGAWWTSPCPPRASSTSTTRRSPR